MRLVQMAYLDLRPPSAIDTPGLTLTVEDTEVRWAARWADPRGPWDHFRKPEVHALISYASPEVQQALPQLSLATEADPNACTPLWLNPPFRQQDKENANSIGDPHLLLTSEVTELIVAVAPLRSPLERDEARDVRLPEDALQGTLRAIEVFADVLSVTHRSNRRLGSPKIPIGLLPETNAEVSWLNESRTICGLGQLEVSMEPQWSLDFAHVPPRAIDGRVEGWALLADVFSQDWPTGRFRELWRFFERAFALPSGKLAGPLGHFLKSGSQNYSHKEVEKWLHLRGPVVHGDRREALAVAADVQPLLSRMEYAAYDILINKKNWRTRDIERRVSGVNDEPTQPGAENPDLQVPAIHDRSATFVMKPRYGAGPLRLTQPEWALRLDNQWPAPF